MIATRRLLTGHTSQAASDHSTATPKGLRRRAKEALGDGHFRHLYLPDEDRDHLIVVGDRLERDVVRVLCYG
jgi:hypothetical protein